MVKPSIRALLSVAIPLVLAGCPNKQPSPVADAAQPAPTSSGVQATPTSSGVQAEKRAPRPQGKAPIQKATAKAYLDAMKKGRAETTARRYDSAIAAFNAAIVALPGDARAISERGYAKLLDGKLDEARRDLRDAEARTKDPKLLAQIHYNHGLVAEKLGKAEEAKASFARSNTLRPSKAAAAKLGSGPSCGAVVEVGSSKSAVAKDWLSLYEALRVAQKAETKVPSEAEAKARLCTRVPEGRCSDLASFAEEDEMSLWTFHPVLKISEGYLVGTDALSMRSDLPCGGEEKLTVTEASGLRILRLENEPGMRVPVCEDKAGELGDCGPDEIPVSSACGTSEKETSVVIFDLAKKSLAATVRITGEGRTAPAVAVEGRTLKVTGGGCDSRISL